MQLGDIKELKIIVKADVQGSVEAVRQSLEKLSNDEVRVHVIHGGVGAVNESDVMLANASNAIIVGFNVRPDPVAAETPSGIRWICVCTASSTTASRKSSLHEGYAGTEVQREPAGPG